MAELKGELSLMPLADLAIWLANRAVSGVLTVEQGAIVKEFTLHQGRAIRAASNDPREYFGQFLVHLGLITEDQLERAFQTQRETKVLLGRILVMIGIVPEEQVVQTLRVKIAESLLDAFRWSEGRFHLRTAGAGEVRPEIEVAVPLVEVHREGLRRAAMWEQFNRIFPRATMFLSVNEGRIPASATPDTLDGKIIQLARHNLSIEAIALELHATDYQIAARLFELKQQGAIEPRETSESIRVPDELLGTGAITHAEMARAAIGARDWSAAYRHIQAGAKADPSNPDIQELVRQLEASMNTEPTSDVLDKDAVPTLLRQPDEARAKRMNAKQRYILARIDGKRSLTAIIQVSPMRDVEAMEIVRQFLKEGLVRLG